MGDKPLQFKPGEAIEFHSLIHPEPLHEQDLEVTDPSIKIGALAEETGSHFINISEEEQRNQERLTGPSHRPVSKWHRS